MYEKRHGASGMKRSKTIGIVGGVGPYAGIDLNRKIFEQTLAGTDQDHLRVVLISWSELIPDRTEFLLGNEGKNPGVPIARVIGALEAAGAEVVGIPCNTAHSPEIFSVIGDRCRKNGYRAKILHMIREVAAFLREDFPEIRRVGVLATNGTVRSGLYRQILEPEGFEVVYPSESTQTQKVHRMIYDQAFGIKVQSSPVTEVARKELHGAMRELVEAGSDGIVLACTELPLAITENRFAGRPLIDATLVLARALVREAAPQQLRQLARVRLQPLKVQERIEVPPLRALQF